MLGTHLLGQSPIDSVRLPRGHLRWRVKKEGFAGTELFTSNSQLEFELVEENTPRRNMILVPSNDVHVVLHGFPASGTTVSLSDYWIDKYELTNAEFKTFIDSGGYENRDYWRFPFDDRGRAVGWDEAMATFRDRTGRPGPSTWEGGTYAPGEGERPVSGVSWYEAAAYAEFVGKSLPTIYHWLGGTDVGLAAQIVPYSNIDNFTAAKPEPVGSFQAGRFGLFDMAGNVREWIWNRAGDAHYILGGAWNEPVYMFYEADVRSALDRSPGNGFRLAVYSEGQDHLPNELTQALAFDASDTAVSLDPVSDEVFEAYRSLYGYDATPLEPATDALDESPTYWRTEKVSFTAAYAGERVTAFLFLPNNVEPPYQTVVYWPYSGVILASSSDDLLYQQVIEFVLKSGRAVIYPVYRGSYERNPGLTTWVPNTSRFYADNIIKAVQDLRRSVDYLETRRDIDIERIAFFGTSWGALLGSMPLALEARISAGILLAGGLPTARARPEVTESNFAPRVTIPVLMINGRYDYIFPLESSQQVLFDLFATPADDKKHRLFETGHGVRSYRTAEIELEILSWLDRFLGVVN